jgi:ribosome-associated protein
LALTSAVAEPQKKISRLTRNSKLLKVIIQSIHDKKGEHVVSIDLRKVSEAVSDFFIVCEAPSTVQVRAIADWIEMQVKEECGEYPYKREGTGVSQWVLVDYVNVVIHVFLTETRKFYKLEEMWNDGISQEELEAGTEKEATKPKKEPKELPANKKKPKAL